MIFIANRNKLFAVLTALLVFVISSAVALVTQLLLMEALAGVVGGDILWDTDSLPTWYYPIVILTGILLVLGTATTTVAAYRSKIRRPGNR